MTAMEELRARIEKTQKVADALEKAMYSFEKKDYITAMKMVEELGDTSMVQGAVDEVRFFFKRNDIDIQNKINELIMYTNEHLDDPKLDEAKDLLDKLLHDRHVKKYERLINNIQEKVELLKIDKLLEEGKINLDLSKIDEAEVLAASLGYELQLDLNPRISEYREICEKNIIEKQIHEKISYAKDNLDETALQEAYKLINDNYEACSEEKFRLYREATGAYKVIEENKLSNIQQNNNTQPALASQDPQQNNNAPASTASQDPQQQNNSANTTSTSSTPSDEDLAERLLEKAETTGTPDDVQIAQNAIDALVESDRKNELKARLDALNISLINNALNVNVNANVNNNANNNGTNNSTNTNTNNNGTNITTHIPSFEALLNELKEVANNGGDIDSKKIEKLEKMIEGLPSNELENYKEDVKKVILYNNAKVDYSLQNKELETEPKLFGLSEVITIASYAITAKMKEKIVDKLVRRRNRAVNNSNDRKAKRLNKKIEQADSLQTSFKTMFNAELIRKLKSSIISKGTSENKTKLLNKALDSFKESAYTSLKDKATNTSIVEDKVRARNMFEQLMFAYSYTNDSEIEELLNNFMAEIESKQTFTAEEIVALKNEIDSVVTFNNVNNENFISYDLDGKELEGGLPKIKVVSK